MHTLDMQLGNGSASETLLAYVKVLKTFEV